MDPYVGGVGGLELSKTSQIRPKMACFSPESPPQEQSLSPDVPTSLYALKANAVHISLMLLEKILSQKCRIPYDTGYGQGSNKEHLSQFLVPVPV